MMTGMTLPLFSKIKIYNKNKIKIKNNQHIYGYGHNTCMVPVLGYQYCNLWQYPAPRNTPGCTKLLVALLPVPSTCSEQIMCGRPSLDFVLYTGAAPIAAMGYAHTPAHVAPWPGSLPQPACSRSGPHCLLRGPCCSLTRHHCSLDCSVKVHKANHDQGTTKKRSARPEKTPFAKAAIVRTVTTVEPIHDSQLRMQLVVLILSVGRWTGSMDRSVDHRSQFFKITGRVLSSAQQELLASVR